MVVIILLLGSALLHATRQQLAASVALVADERQHIIDFYGAQAALAWGTKLSWSFASGWQCQTEAQQQWRTCLHGTTPQRGLLRGERLPGERSAIALWRWVQPDPDAPGRVLQAAHGWIDFCPLVNPADCEPDAP